MNEHRARIIKASEIGVYEYCQRAWWYQKQGIQSDNLSSLQAGTQFHKSHAKGIIVIRTLRFLAAALIILSIILFGVYLLL